MLRYRWLFAWIPVCVVTAVLYTPVHAIVVFNQPSDFPAGVLLASQNDTSSGGLGNFATTYDNFTLALTIPITDVHWQGGFFEPPEQATISAFTLTFWDNSGADTPGLPLLTAHIPGNANETLVGLEPGCCLVFDYSVDLPTAFVAAGGTTYWLSIVPDVPFPPQWGWHTGLGGDARSVQDFQGTRTVLDDDLAFSLTSVPGPASLALVVTGAVCCAGVIRRRMSKGRNM